MLILILIILALSAIGFTVFTYESQIARLRDDLILLRTTINNLKHKIPVQNKRIEVEFLKPEHRSGIIKINTPVFLSPDKNGLLEKTTIHMEVQILDSISYNGLIWFYVALPVDRHTNCRGWINKSYFSSFS